jgi:hypothetical protein
MFLASLVPILVFSALAWAAWTEQPPRRERRAARIRRDVLRYGFAACAVLAVFTAVYLALV